MATIASAGLIFVGCGGSGSQPKSLEAEAGPISMRRLTTEQYRRSVHAIFGDDIAVPSRIDPVARREGLDAVGSSFGSISSSAFEKYEAAATIIAEQALDPSRRAGVLACTPASTTGSDSACARQFLSKIGRRLFRRPLTEMELNERVSIADASAEELEDFYEGLQIGLSSLLVSPNFLFDVQTATADPEEPSRFLLTGNSLASRLSFFIVNSTPDEELQSAGEDGTLLEDAVLASHVDRLVESSDLEIGFRALFTDLFELKQFDDGQVRKDTTLFPAYNTAAAADAKEQTLQTITTHLLAGGDTRDLFTTRETVMSRSLGPIYETPVSVAEGFEPYTFSKSSGRAGLLSHVSLLALYSHEGRSSATLRGQFVREVLLCQEIPDPPGDVDFSLVNNTMGDLLTARDRLQAHVTRADCAVCHDAMDPIGLALENFDAIGEFRATENGATIDPSGDLDGDLFDDAVGLGEALRNHPELGPCLTSNVLRYATGRNATVSEVPFVDALHERFAKTDYRLPDLVKEIVLSEGFRTTSGPRIAEEGVAQ